MSEKRESEHLEPVVFVDLLDGVPVEASKRLHLEGCDRCRAELGELESTLSLLKGDAVNEPAFSRSRRPTWVAAAAVLLLAGAALYWAVGTSEYAPTPSVVMESLLPSVEEDEEFKLLLALSDAIEDEWAPEDSAPFGTDAELELDELTPAERQRFVQELAEELRSSSL